MLPLFQSFGGLNVIRPPARRPTVPSSTSGSVFQAVTFPAASMALAYSQPPVKPGLATLENARFISRKRSGPPTTTLSPPAPNAKPPESDPRELAVRFVIDVPLIFETFQNQVTGIAEELVP